MPTDAAFRLSVYLTLAFACAAVGYAESILLIEAPIVAGLVIVALVVLYRLETRVELLTIPAANRLGLILGLANFVWAVFRILRELNDPQMLHTDWAMLGLALTGPFVMTLMPAKLARREKHAGDYWWLQGLGLAAAALAGALAEDLFAFLLIGAYIACATWSLAAFALLRAAGSIRPIPGHPPEVRVAGVVADHRPRFGLAYALGLAAFAAAVTTPLYLLTPRSTFEKLEFGKARVEIGYAADQMIDLTQTGDLRANEQVAFEVTADTANGPKTDLSPDQRWRGQVKGRYQSGKWSEGGDFKLPAVAPAPRLAPPGTAPEVWPDQTTLTFAVTRGVRGRFLADPATWVADRPVPVAWITGDGYRLWAWGGNGTFVSAMRQRNTSDTLRYVQAWRPEPDRDLSPPLELIDLDLERVLRALRHNPVPKVKDYADALITRMVENGRLPADHLDRGKMLPRPEFHDRIARAFTAHLATTPTLTYTTELRRERKDLDPIEDFLYHTRSGHCERFATALVLMLRSQGIPAVIVLGFKGCEPTDEPGRYVVRQENAHAWVEALIEDFQPRPWWEVWRPTRWRSLDPTPGGAAATAASDAWVDRASSWLRRLYNTYVINYTPEQQARALRKLAEWLTSVEVLGTLVAVVAALAAARSLARRRSAGVAATPPGRWFDRLLAVLAAHGFTLRPGETAREFATRVADELRLRATTEAAAEVPLDWADAYYESRFGGQALPPDRLAELDARLEELRRALVERGNRTGGQQ